MWPLTHIHTDCIKNKNLNLHNKSAILEKKKKKKMRGNMEADAYTTNFSNFKSKVQISLCRRNHYSKYHLPENWLHSNC